MRRRIIKLRMGAVLCCEILSKRGKIMNELDYVILLFFIATMNTTYNSSHKYFTRKRSIVFGKLLATRNEYLCSSVRRYFHVITQPDTKTIDNSFASIGNDDALFTPERWKNEISFSFGNIELHFDYLWSKRTWRANVVGATSSEWWRGHQSKLLKRSVTSQNVVLIPSTDEFVGVGCQTHRSEQGI